MHACAYMHAHARGGRQTHTHGQASKHVHTHIHTPHMPVYTGTNTTERTHLGNIYTYMYAQKLHVQAIIQRDIHFLNTGCGHQLYRWQRIIYDEAAARTRRIDTVILCASLINSMGQMLSCGTSSAVIHSSIAAAKRIISHPLSLGSCPVRNVTNIMVI